MGEKKKDFIILRGTLIKGSGKDRKIYEIGDKVELTDSEAKNYGRAMLRQVGGDGDPVSPDDANFVEAARLAKLKEDLDKRAAELDKRDSEAGILAADLDKRAAELGEAEGKLAKREADLAEAAKKTK